LRGLRSGTADRNPAHPALVRSPCTSNGNTMGKLEMLGDVWQFLRVRKKFWLAPIVIVLLLLSLLIVATQGSALAPFIYALF